MITMKGKYNSANIMVNELDQTTRGQIQDFLNNPSFGDSYIAIMPDCHKGSGSCIGFTMQMNDRIIPSVVGVDLGCGMLSWKFNTKNLDVVAFDEYIKKCIPSGFSIHNKSIATSPWSGDTIFQRLSLDEGKVERAIGTLGGGNHFIEAGFGSDGFLWVTIHSGSRNFGLRVANYHQRRAKELCDKWGAETRGMPFLLADSDEGQRYLVDAQIAQSYASLNRSVMMGEIAKFIGGYTIDMVESIHNFIDNEGMIRKGATPAHAGQHVIIPFNMRDGLAICVGKGNKKWNYSAPHGAGRILSRSKAKELLDVEYFQEDMKQAGVFTTTANISTLDESPDAYKDYKMILAAIEETVDVVELIKPVYNFKSSGE
jgi:tRNA-splicing ligase RtcB (3'-phosphate/5'-hydroxy nucleic acid ligase)